MGMPFNTKRPLSLPPGSRSGLAEFVFKRRFVPEATGSFRVGTFGKDRPRSQRVVPWKGSLSGKISSGRAFVIKLGLNENYYTPGSY